VSDSSAAPVAISKDRSDQQLLGKYRPSRFQGFVRRFVPSLAPLTFNPLAKIAFNAADGLPRLMFPAFRRLPPNHLRVRVGVDSQIFHNQLKFFYSFGFWLFAFSERWCRLNSTIVDLGCGCGRYAHHLRDLHFAGRRFNGRYIGIDIDDEALDWCRKHYDERFTFLKSSDASRTYRKEASANQPYRLEIDDETVDLIFSTSLFTHLLESELVNYLEESARVLVPGGVAAHSVFSLDHPPPTYGTRHTFRHRRGNAHLESEKTPEAAVAYRERFLIDTALAAGFETAEVLAEPGTLQPFLVCRKPITPPQEFVVSRSIV
jgi:SAM-dependent methyltransferase